MRICDMWYSPMLSSKLHGFPPFIELFLLSKLVFKRLDIEGLFCPLFLRKDKDPIFSNGPLCYILRVSINLL